MHASTLEWPLNDVDSEYGSEQLQQSSDVVELPILLPDWQVSALEEAARERGMTIGQLLRRVFSELFPRPLMHHAK